MSHRNIDEGLCCVGLAFVVFAQTPPPSQPTKGPFHDPTLALNMETLLSRNRFDDVQALSKLLPHPVHQLAGITTVSPDELNRSISLKQGSQEALSRRSPASSSLLQARTFRHRQPKRARRGRWANGRLPVATALLRMRQQRART